MKLTYSPILATNTIQNTLPFKGIAPKPPRQDFSIATLPVTFYHPTFLSSQYIQAFTQTLMECPSPKLLENLAKRGWSVTVTPEAQAKPVSINLTSRIIDVRPQKETNPYGAEDALEAIAKVINAGGLSDEAPPSKKFGWFYQTQKLSNHPDFQKHLSFAHGDRLGSAILKALFGEAYYGDPTGEKFFEMLVKTHLVHMNSKVWPLDNKQWTFKDAHWEQAWDHVDEVLQSHLK